MHTTSSRHLEAVVRDLNGMNLARCLLQRGRYIIGQDRRNEIVVDDPSVSTKHARLTVAGDNELFLIEDLDSANGTRVDGNPVTGEIQFSIGSRVEIGSTVLEFHRAGIPASIFSSLPPDFLRPNRYNIGDAVVEGSTSTIFEAHDTSLGRTVALKIMRPESQSRPSDVLRFVREAQIASQLQHSSILPVYEINSDPQSRLFYTTRFIEGESLGSILRAMADGTSTEITLSALLSIFQKASDAIAYAHSRGVIHCGLTPDAISIGSYGEVFVTNWSLARAGDLDAEGKTLPSPINVSRDSNLPALTAFTSPEQASGPVEDINPLCDVYSLGGILYQILSLRPPITEETDAGLLDAILSGNIDPLSNSLKEPMPHCPGNHIPEALADLAMEALSLDPTKRPPSVLKLQKQIADRRTNAQNENSIWKHFSGFLGKH